ncbi:hypothetical protein OZ666_13770 [Elizabethkingia sp. HX QKY]|uniref:hypothetical protein n=1 Tax=Elizabethkingia TaxID=308865 RepID=UPI002A249498|nr:hypothetical protein [Elizabethkingia sp. HX QKY]MDX8572754.1 hypothetical protein [Elizabethkingia sp. HX QKY]
MIKILTKFILFLGVGCTYFFGQDYANPDTQEYHQLEPILVEVMAGSKWGMLQSIVLKKITPQSKFSFFNLTNYEKTYKKEEPANYIIQSLAYYQPAKNFHLGLGANLKAFGGFKPLLAVAYIYNSRNITLIAQPSIELDKNGVSELFALFEYRGAKNRKFEPFFSAQTATSYAAKNWNHDYTYVNLRAGIEYKNFRFGPAANFRMFGPNPKGQINIGAFFGVVIY